MNDESQISLLEFFFLVRLFREVFFEKLKNVFLGVKLATVQEDSSNRF
jgi:hypothetical protein